MAFTLKTLRAMTDHLPDNMTLQVRDKISGEWVNMDVALVAVTENDCVLFLAEAHLEI